MRNFYDRFTMNYNFSFLAIYVLLLSGTIAHAQVIKEFTPRTSTHTPNREIYTLKGDFTLIGNTNLSIDPNPDARRSEEHTSELQSRGHLVCRLLLEKKKQN